MIINFTNFILIISYTLKSIMFIKTYPNDVKLNKNATFLKTVRLKNSVTISFIILNFVTLSINLFEYL